MGNHYSITKGMYQYFGDVPLRWWKSVLAIMRIVERIATNLKG